MFLLLVSFSEPQPWYFHHGCEEQIDRTLSRHRRDRDEHHVAAEMRLPRRRAVTGRPRSAG